MEYLIKEGDYCKMGAVCKENSITFTFAGQEEQPCSILLYDKKNSTTEEIAVPQEFCVGSLHSIEIQGLEYTQYNYNYKIDGQVIVDPYARRIIGREKWFETSRYSANYQVCGGFAQSDFDWKQDKAPKIIEQDMVMYKLHVRNFSMDSGERAAVKGTFDAVIHKIPYLKELGITTVECMPIYEFEELVIPQEADLPDYVTWKEERRTSQKEAVQIERVNCWGYVKGDYFAPKASYAKGKDAENALKTMVYTLHEAGMECVMEMFFPGSVNQNLILDALRFWVMEYHIDGFHLVGENLPIRAIAQDLVLSRTKLFYESFDEDLLEWNKKHPHLYIYRDEFLYPVRKMMNHMDTSLTAFADQMRKQKENAGFINYIASNNGFTLWDVFSYSEKHNEDNGEHNADGNDWNYSANYGVEGVSRKRYIEQLRAKQLRNAVTILALGQGVPLIYEGDEIANSQKGNNNAYCQDNKTGWVNWRNEKKYGWLTEYVKKMLAFRRAHPILHMDKPMQMHDYKGLGYPDLSYHCDSAWVTGFEQSRQSVGMLYCGLYATDCAKHTDDLIYIAYNFHTGKQFLALPKLQKKQKWYRVVDTGLEGGFLEESLAVQADRVEITGMSIQILIGK